MRRLLTFILIQLVFVPAALFAECNCPGGLQAGYISTTYNNVKYARAVDYAAQRVSARYVSQMPIIATGAQFIPPPPPPTYYYGYPIFLHGPISIGSSYPVNGIVRQAVSSTGGQPVYILR
ncbi:hypothetical protein KKA47_03205 [bacterium]|nr:hypothetical protein [bacterium]